MIYEIGIGSEYVWRIQLDTPIWPVSDSGDEACHLAMGMNILTSSNARLWSEPNVLKATFISVDMGQAFMVTGGPVWGRITLDETYSGWWWQVRSASGNLDGWLWEDRIQECGK